MKACFLKLWEIFFARASRAIPKLLPLIRKHAADSNHSQRRTQLQIVWSKRLTRKQLLPNGTRKKVTSAEKRATTQDCVSAKVTGPKFFVQKMASAFSSSSFYLTELTMQSSVEGSLIHLVSAAQSTCCFYAQQKCKRQSQSLCFSQQLERFPSIIISTCRRKFHASLISSSERKRSHLMLRWGWAGTAVINIHEGGGN